MATDGGHVTQGRPTRILAIDLARGIALSLMIVSHGVKGLLSFDQFPDWGLVPIHLITKFSSTIFFMTFGLSLAVSFAPATEFPERWKKKRKRLILRGLTILFWYKILTVIEMSHLHSPDEILKALLYQDFPSYSEILGFYALVLLWIPLVLPYWQRSSMWIKGIFPFLFAGASYLISTRIDFGNWMALKAILVEDGNFYTWGQFSRVPFVFLGMFLGPYLARHHLKETEKNSLSFVLTASALGLGFLFTLLYRENLSELLHALALNEGKHPPELSFILFSLAGALAILAFSVFVGARAKRFFAPVILIGQDPLGAFVFHITAIFIFFRLAFGLWLKLSYPEALGLSILLIFMTAAWIKLKRWSKNHEKDQVPNWTRALSRHHQPREPQARPGSPFTGFEEAQPLREEISVASAPPQGPPGTRETLPREDWSLH